MVSQLSVGTIIDERYELLELIGQGGMGKVFKARQLGLDRIVAIKFLHSNLLADKDSLARFEREGKVLSELPHKNISHFYLFSVWEKQYPYIVMEFIEGESLRSLLLSEHKIPWTRALNIAIQVCDAMESAHKIGIINRDLKPNNIMLLPSPTPDFVKIIDFGLAKIATDGSEQKLTQTGILIGSIHYLSPEQCGGKPADMRSDIYSLACIIYECISGNPPFDADNPIGLMHKHANEAPQSLSECLPQGKLPKTLDAVLFKALAKKPEDRYQSIADFKQDMQYVLSGDNANVSAPIEPWSQPLPLSSPVKSGNRILFVSILVATAILLPALLISLQDPGAIRVLIPYFHTKGSKDGTQDCLSTAQWCLANGRPLGAKMLFLEALRFKDTNITNQEKVALLSKIAEICQTTGSKSEAQWFALKALELTLQIQCSNAAVIDVPALEKYSIANIAIAKEAPSYRKLKNMLWNIQQNAYHEFSPKFSEILYISLLDCLDHVPKEKNTSDAKAHALMQLGNAYFKQDQPEKAISCLKQACVILEADKNSTAGFYSIAQTAIANYYYKHGKLTEAEDCCHKAIAHCAVGQTQWYHRIEPKILLIDRLIKAKKENEAKLALQDLALELKENHLHMQYGPILEVADCYQRLSMHKEAERILVEALPIPASVSPAQRHVRTTLLSTLGDFYVRQKRYNEAVTYYEQYLSDLEKTGLAPPFVGTFSTLSQLVVAESLLGNTAKARQWMKQLAKASQNLPDYKQVNFAAAHCLCGQAYLQLKEWQKGKEEFQRSLKIINMLGDNITEQQEQETKMWVDQHVEKFKKLRRGSQEIICFNHGVAARNSLAIPDWLQAKKELALTLRLLDLLQ